MKTDTEKPGCVRGRAFLIPIFSIADFVKFSATESREQGSGGRRSGPADVEGVDLLVAGVAGQDRRAVGLNVSVLRHSGELWQRGRRSEGRRVET